VIKLTDSRGRKSLTLGFVTIAFIIGTASFVYATLHGVPPDLGSYGLFVSGSILPWVAREYIEKNKQGDQDDG
jgi:hypothetical protein